jgi:hypothetical protein
MSASASRTEYSITRYSAEPISARKPMSTISSLAVHDNKRYGSDD